MFTTFTCWYGVRNVHRICVPQLFFSPSNGDAEEVGCKTCNKQSNDMGEGTPHFRPRAKDVGGKTVYTLSMHCLTIWGRGCHDSVPELKEVVVL